ncbi:MAG TPA: hypothetical protein VIM52_11645 [Stellaceae bacterium]
MAITSLDTHQTVKDLTAAGFTDAQAEALTQALRQGQQIDLTDLATKADLAATKADLHDEIAEVRREMAEIKAELIKWVVGIGFAQIAAILAIVRLFPAGHP